MRLLNTHSWEMQEFISDDHVPPYAILSHTWEVEEVSYQQWENRQSHDVSHMKGYNKILQFGELAAKNGYDWVWVDTCCIDKKSSAELTEAINAMFRWYKSASICYVYLSDVLIPSPPPPTTTTSPLLQASTTSSHSHSHIRTSRWLTRGWTLQELIAPRHLTFYSATWTRLGTKDDLIPLLTTLTNIPASILSGTGDLSSIPIARKMSWASRRTTSRVEDMAYCLLGLFDVNMPLIYGEGKRAFQRLQGAIMEGVAHDQSLFAWGRVVSGGVDGISGVLDSEEVVGAKVVKWKGRGERSPLMGLLAEGPGDFVDSGEVEPVDHGYVHVLTRRRAPRLVNGGVLLDLVVYKRFMGVMYWDGLDGEGDGGGSGGKGVTQPAEVELVVLLCKMGKKGSMLVGLVIQSWGDGYYSRTNEMVPVDLFVSQCRFEEWKKTRHVVPYRPMQLRHRDILVRRWMTSFKQNQVERTVVASGPAWRQRWGDRVLRLEEEAEGDEDITFFFEIHSAGGVAITLNRVLLMPRGEDEDEERSMSVKGGGKREESLQMGLLCVGASPYIKNGSSSKDGLKIGKFTPVHGRSFRKPAYYHVMKIPSDTWELEIDGWPQIYARAERIPLDAGHTTAVDVLDFFVYPDGTTAQWAKRSVSTAR